MLLKSFAETLSALTLLNNLPADFLARIQHLTGGEYNAFLDALNQSAPTSVRLHPFKKNSLFENEEKIPWCDEGRYLNKRPSFTFDPLFHSGCYYVQEASSMLLECVWKEIMPSGVSLRVLDMCAAPGGKSTHLLSLLEGNGYLVANETVSNRNNVLRQNIIKWGYPNCLVTQNKPEDFSSLTEFFDVVLVDAPCSGEGLFRKDKDAIGEWSVQNVVMCAARQKDILKHAIASLKSGGFLIYSTCTYEQDENDGSVASLPLNLIRLNKAPEGLLQTKFGYQAYPHRIKGEGFYFSVMQKDGDFVPSGIINSSDSSSRKHKSLTEQWLKSSEKYTELKLNDLLFALPEGWINEYGKLQSQLYIRHAGICLGETRGKDFFPSHDLALSIEIKQDLPCVELNYEDAILYLRGEAPRLKTDIRGWCLVKYESKNLGWIKVLENRINNYYPKNSRILKQT